MNQNKKPQYKMTLTKQQEKAYNYLKAEGLNKRQIAETIGVPYRELSRATKGW